MIREQSYQTLVVDWPERAVVSAELDLIWFQQKLRNIELFSISKVSHADAELSDQSRLV